MNKKWQTYQKLELVADSVVEPVASRSIIVAQLNNIWQFWTNRSVQKLSFEQQAQHLEQCLAADNIAVDTDKQINAWRTLWAILNQPIFESENWKAREPKVEQVSDQGGQVWWYVYDPQTQQSVYLESETEVMIWLEEHFSR